ncbi:nucleolar protein 10 isoform X2 [Abrus precatorius]|uniref:Nucleolar protein 10 isoform X2 n=1 Tax=Abrus precatorius TaxID=3816 RepID=A0A8B8LT66_ABRPR|nr:nucleolar protein 10 isoform X2 [Abrus precatorius]
MATRDGGMKSTSINGVKMYTIASQQPSVASWLSSKKKKSHRNVKSYTQNLQLLEDLRFATAATKIKATPDGEYIIASGIYPSQVKVYEVRELGLKFERHFDSEIVDFQVLTDDYSKLAFLCADRSVCLHAKYGKHYSLRIPRMGRDITYDCWSCDLLCAASSPDLYRINLEQGRFLSSLNTQSPALNVVSRSKLHGLVACGGEDGAVECFDMRVRSSVGRIDAVGPSGDVDQEVTALEFDADGGFLMAVGSSAGKVLIYDLRSSHPVRIQDHMYGSSILDIKWHRTLNYEQPMLITSDSHVVRIWNPETGEGLTSIEPTTGTINDVCTFPGSGLILLALDCSQMPSYFIPSLGPAPKWCSSLENFTEELDMGGQTTIYDHYKFLTKEELERLNLTNLIGTNLLRAYMHGFFINHALYKKAKALADPFEYEVYIEQQKREKMEAERASRITIRKKLPKVNRALAARLLECEEAENEKRDADDGETKKASKKKKGLSMQDLQDERFKAIFTNEDFEIKDSSQEYLALHPMGSKKQTSLLKEHFEPVMSDDDQSLSDSDASTSSKDEPENRVTEKTRVPRMYEIKNEQHAEAFWSQKSLAGEDSLPMGDRVAALKGDQQSSRVPRGVKQGPGGSREITFTTRSSAKYKEDKEDQEVQHRKKRGVQSLGLKTHRSGFHGQGRGKRGNGRRGRR